MSFSMRRWRDRSKTLSYSESLASEIWVHEDKDARMAPRIEQHDRSIWDDGRVIGTERLYQALKE